MDDSEFEDIALEDAEQNAADLLINNYFDQHEDTGGVNSNNGDDNRTWVQFFMTKISNQFRCSLSCLGMTTWIISILTPVIGM